MKDSHSLMRMLKLLRLVKKLIRRLIRLQKQMLFTLNRLKKIKDTGRIGIVRNRSHSSRDASSGPSEISRFIIENDWLDAIVQLSSNTLYIIINL